MQYMTGSSFVRLKFGLSADYISFACERILPDITNNRLSRLCEPRIDTKPVVLRQANIFTPTITPSLSSHAKPIFLPLQLHQVCRPTPSQIHLPPQLHQVCRLTPSQIHLPQNEVKQSTLKNN